MSVDKQIVIYIKGLNSKSELWYFLTCGENQRLSVEPETNRFAVTHHLSHNTTSTNKKYRFIFV